MASSSSWPLILLFLLNLSVFVSSQRVNNRLNTVCGSSGNYTGNSIYSSNLHTLLSSIRSHDKIEYGFYNFSQGNNNDQVNGIALCRGDISTADCRICLNTSTLALLESCPNQKEATIWYDNCMLWYSNKTIVGTPQSSNVFRMSNPNNATNVTLFNQALQDLLPKLKDEASSGDSTKKFAVGQVNLTALETLYALVQCTPDLSKLDCGICLSTAFDTIKKYMDGRQGGRALGRSCNFRYESYLFYVVPSSPSPPVASNRPTATTNSSTKTTTGSNNGNETPTIIIAVVSSLIGVIFLNCICICILVHKLRKPKHKDRPAVDEITTVESLQIDFNTIRVASNDFSEGNKLGEGGFGSVYKGKLLDGREIAVKRLSRYSGQGDIEFKNEVLLVAKLQHRNLVRLLGFSLENEERLLVYEFVPNSSLDHFLFDRIRRTHLDWERRYKIIGGIARGLLYLHEDSRLRIIHRDLKASNILLDDDMHPKISDFGMARLFSLDQTQGNTSRIVGTYGYMAPEYAMHGQFSVKSDVYSFGVLILELISGQKNNCYRNCDGENVEDLVNHVWESWRNGTAFDVVDPTIWDGLRTEIMRCIHIGLLCVQENVAARPTMATVVLMLNSYSLTLQVPSQPAYFVHSATEPEAPILSSSEAALSDRSTVNYSVNEVSVTEQYPR